uniref:Uncharacterized protein n=1 Tax=Salix viminalis TaxID=40686 RepID=A0A6N2LVG1_SALVM
MHSARVARRKPKRVLNPSMLDTWQCAINCLRSDNSHVTNLGQGFCLFPVKVLAMAITEEPILARLDRLDNMMRELEELRGCIRSPRSSCPSTPSSGTLTSGAKFRSLISPEEPREALPSD